jgi:hypothetical protein
VRARPTGIIRSSQRDIIMPDLACDLFENAIWLSRFIELEEKSFHSAVGKKKNVSMTSADVKLFLFFPFSHFPFFGGCPIPAITFVWWH